MNIQIVRYKDGSFEVHIGTDINTFHSKREVVDFISEKIDEILGPKIQILDEDDGEY